MDRDKLAKLRKHSVDIKAKKHKELLASSTSIKDAVLALHTVINEQQPYDDTKLVQQLNDLKESLTFSEDITRLENALKASSGKEKLDEVIQAVGNINNTDVVEAVNALVAKLEENTPDQSPDNFQPVRRVIKVGTRLVFDDTKTPIAMGGGGGGGSSSVQSTLVRDTDDGKAIAVVNPDGSELNNGLVAGRDFDYLSVVATDSDTDTLTYKTGGSGGAAVQTLVINYTSSSVDKISDSFSELSWA